jgi:type I restriction enzyme M protein
VAFPQPGSTTPYVQGGPDDGLARLVDKLWSYCDVLRDDGVGVIEYTEQLTYLLFLKMAHERATRRLMPQQIVPEEYSWQKLLDAQGDQLEFEYTRILNGLGGSRG